MILLIDNFDSFVHNLARYLERLGQSTCVVRNNALELADIYRLQPAAIVISPGPCTPQEAGCSLEVVREFTGCMPILGVCLGHQTIGAAWGGKVVRASEPMHGRTSSLRHSQQHLFAGMVNPLTVCRYHSLVLEEASLPNCLEVSARLEDGTIMAVRHRQFPTFGVQFHPEAILTEGGFELLANFLRLANLPLPASLPSSEWERPAFANEVDENEALAWSRLPITF